VRLLKQVLTQLKVSRATHQTISIPRFNKALDRPFSQPTWPVVTSDVDIVLFEGWCWGVTAENADDLIQPINEFEAKYDPQGVWRRKVNYTLQENYQPLYALIDNWVMLKAPSFDVVYQWRLEQEQKLALKLSTEKVGDNSIMSAEQISKFIQHFQRLTERSFIELPEKVNVLFELDSDREIITSRGLC
jgi:D-glycerate 3-kinase